MAGAPYSPNTLCSFNHFRKSKHFLFDFLRRALRVARSPRTIRPIDPIEAFSLRPLNPVLNSIQRNSETTSHGTLRDFFASSSGNQVAALIGSQLFDSWITPHVFPLGIAAGRSTCKYPQPAMPQKRGGGTPVGLRPPSVPPPSLLSSYFPIK